MKTVFDEKVIKAKIITLAPKIESYYRHIDSKGEKPLIVIPILNGGIFFFVDLYRELRLKKEMGIISTNHYGKAEVPFKSVKLRYCDADVEGKNVLLVDEICFTGKTLQNVKEIFLNEGALDVKSVVLVDHIRDEKIYSPDWSAVEYYGDAWLYGYGMDIDGLYRELMDIVE